RRHHREHAAHGESCSAENAPLRHREGSYPRDPSSGHPIGMPLFAVASHPVSASTSPLDPRALLWLLRGLLVAPLRAVAGSAPCAGAVDRDVRRFLQPRMDLPLPSEVSARELTE